MNKCIQLYETYLVRHGIMLVGPSGSGKTTIMECLAAALTELGTKTVLWRMNPKVRPRLLWQGSEFDSLRARAIDIISRFRVCGNMSFDPKALKKQLIIKRCTQQDDSNIVPLTDGSLQNIAADAFHMCAWFLLHSEWKCV